MPTPKIVALDGYTLNPGDLSWDAIRAIGDFEVYDRSTAKEGLERAKAADILLLNKFVLSQDMMQQLPNLKCICITATGYNNVDVAAAKARNIIVCNAVGYGTTAVAQHVFALLLAMTNRVESHHQSVLQANWASCPDFCYWLLPIVELAGKTIGIYGFGRIGQKVANIALAFDMKVLATHKHPERDARVGVEFVTIERLFSQSDIISLHAPLSETNKEIVNQRLFSLMRSSAYLINTGRGGLINEADLKDALENEQLAGAALDVLSVEPPPKNHIMMGVKNCIITPHQAWASQSARQRLMDITVANIKAFLEGKPQNICS